MAEGTYVVAVRRSERALAPRDWLERLRSTQGVSVLGSSSGRAQFTADPACLARVRDELGAFFHIEAVIDHRPTTSPPPVVPGRRRRGAPDDGRP